MIHKMHLQSQFFNYIKNGTKKIELRLYDEKRQQINLGDTIKFTTDSDETFETEVIGLLRYQNFSQLFVDFDITNLADESMTKAELLSTLEKFYTPEDQAKYGVLGIRLDK